MNDTEILEWLVNNGAIDVPAMSYRRIMGDTAVSVVRARLDELEVFDPDDDDDE